MIHYFREALEGNGAVFAGNSMLTYSMLQADHHVITPEINDPNYIDFLLDYSIRNQIQAIVPLFDVDLPVLSRNKSRFTASGISVLVSDEEIVNICRDKWLTARFCRENNIRYPQTYISYAELLSDISSGKIDFPLIVKPRWGMGSTAICQADDMQELEVYNKKVKKEIFETYLKFESAGKEDQCVLFQEKISGVEYGLDILNDLNGRFITTVSKRKIAMRAGETDVAEIVCNELFSGSDRKIADALKHIGNLDVDCILMENGAICVLEMNGRFGGQYPFSHLAGVDFPRQIIKWLCGGETDRSLLTPVIGTIGCKDLLPVKMT